jgi:hypothetical protein
MSELERTVTAGAAERVIRSYVGTKSERAALAALSRLLMDSDPLAIPVRPAPASSLPLSELIEKFAQGKNWNIMSKYMYFLEKYD